MPYTITECMQKILKKKKSKFNSLFKICLCFVSVQNQELVEMQTNPCNQTLEEEFREALSLHNQTRSCFDHLTIHCNTLHTMT